MIDNPMAREEDERPNYWEDYSTADYVEEFAMDEGIIAPAIAAWMVAPRADESACETVYQYLPGCIKDDILYDYITENNLENKFNEWWEARHV